MAIKGGMHKIQQGSTIGLPQCFARYNGCIYVCYSRYSCVKKNTVCAILYSFIAQRAGTNFVVFVHVHNIKKAAVLINKQEEKLLCPPHPMFNLTGVRGYSRFDWEYTLAY